MAAPQSWPSEPAELPPSEPGKTVFDEVTDISESTKASDQTEARKQTEARDDANEEGGRS